MALFEKLMTGYTNRNHIHPTFSFVTFVMMILRGRFTASDTFKFDRSYQLAFQHRHFYLTSRFHHTRSSSPIQVCHQSASFALSIILSCFFVLLRTPISQVIRWISLAASFSSFVRELAPTFGSPPQFSSLVHTCFAPGSQPTLGPFVFREFVNGKCPSAFCA